MKLLTLITIFGILLPNIALAAGIQATPEKLEFEVNKTQTKEIIIANPTADIQLFEVYPDDYDRSIKASPASFTLEAGARKKVEITVDSSRLSGMVSTNLSIIAKPLVDSKIQVDAGVKIPIVINTTNSKLNAYIGLGVIALLLAGAGGRYYYRTRKRKNLIAHSL